MNKRMESPTIDDVIAFTCGSLLAITKTLNINWTLEIQELAVKVIGVGVVGVVGGFAGLLGKWMFNQIFKKDK